MLGTALKEALGDKAGVRRFASSLVPLDEALVQVALDLSGRPFLVYEVDPVAEWIGTFDPQLAEEFWRAFAFAAGVTLHIRSLSGRNGHHVIEASFKGVARALRDAVQGRGHRGAVDQGHALSRTVVELLPAIDLRDGHCVRLHQGDFAAETVYDDDPVRVAREFEAAGARWIHVVDLDAARTGTRAHLDQIRLIVRSVACRVEVGGGVRSAESALELLDAGVERVVIGTAAVERPALVEELCREFPGRIAVGLDARGNEVAIRGWVEGSGADLVDARAALRRHRARRARRHRDRARRHPRGPGVRAAGRGARAPVTVPLVASGGVGTLDDLRALARLRSGDRGAGRRDRRPRDLRGALRRGRRARRRSRRP